MKEGARTHSMLTKKMTTPAQSLEIPLSKSKIFLMLLGALVFVAIGCWFVIDPPIIANSFWGNPTKIAITGYASILFFGLCALFFIRKLQSSKPGLIINGKGIVDHSSGISAGVILWSEIVEISVIVVHQQKLIMLYVKEPQSIIDRQESMFKRKLMQLNYKMYGTPVSLTASGLKISFNDLVKIIMDKFGERKRIAEEM